MAEAAAAVEVVATLIAEATAEVTAETIAETIAEVEVGAILRAGAVMPLHTARAEGTREETTVRPAWSNILCLIIQADLKLRWEQS